MAAAVEGSSPAAGLLERVGGLDTEAEWGHQLSLGEQQRVAFLRLLLHAPGLAFLDEATGALDTPTESALYSALRAHCRSYVSVGARRRGPVARLRSAPLALCMLSGTGAAPHTAHAYAPAGHRAELLAYHTHVLEWKGAGQWALRPSARN